MDSARSYKASRMTYNRFALKDYVQGGTNTGAGVTGQQLGTGTMKKETAQEQSQDQENGKENRMLTRDAVTDLRERVESMRIGRTRLRGGADNTVGTMRNYTMRYIFMLLFGDSRTRDIWGEDENAVPVEDGGQTGNATLQLQPFNMKVLSFNTAEYYTEQENTLFSSVGTVRTADGREISFNVDLAMSRSFTQAYEQEMNLAALQQTCDPLVINFDASTATLSDQKFLFDVDADGEEDSISMLGAGSGYLALDKNGDGVINDGSELFGPESGNGFQDLAAYDEDGNGWIDENDAIFSRLKVWSRCGNGESKLLSLKEADVGAIYLGRSDTRFGLTDSDGTEKAVIRSTGFYLKESGSAGTVQHVDFKT